MNNEFGFFVPAELVKGKDSEGKEVMQIAGVASTTDRDTDDEILLPQGFDLSYFTSSGFINWHHRQKDKPSAIIGEPATAKVQKGGKELYVLANLYDTPLAREVYDLGVVLKTQSKTGRKLGFSIEGKVIERDPNDPKIVTKAAITGCAITYQPKNGTSFAEVVKALGADEVVDGVGSVDMEFDFDAFKQDIELLKAEGLNGEELWKSCTDGKMWKDGGPTNDSDNPDEEESEEDEDKVEKTLTTVSGAALKPESLDDIKDNRQALSKSEAEDYLAESGIALDEQFEKLLYKIKLQSNMATRSITKADLDTALNLLEKAADINSLLVKAEDEQPEELEPGEEDEDEEEEDDKKGKNKKEEGVEKATSETPETIEKAVQSMAKHYANGMSAVRTLFEDLTTKIESLQTDLVKAQEDNQVLAGRLEQIEKSPAAVRKALQRPGGATAIEKAWDGDANGGQQAGTELSISRQKAAIVSHLEALAFPENGFNETFAKAMTTFESSGQLSNDAIMALKSKGFNIIA